MKRTIIFIDNFDSFTYNLVDELRVLGNEVIVYRNNTELDVIERLAFERQRNGHPVLFVLSPGPSTPQDANNLLELIERNLRRYPMLGICLGHQALGQVLGGHVRRAGEIVHGKTSDIRHNGTGGFAGLPNPLRVARYHSLIVKDLPGNVRITASCDGMCMALHEPTLRVIGLQFHPESVMTTHGRELLANSIETICPIEQAEPAS